MIAIIILAPFTNLIDGLFENSRSNILLVCVFPITGILFLNVIMSNLADKLNKTAIVALANILYIVFLTVYSNSSLTRVVQFCITCLVFNTKK